ncbi:Serine/threonine-protein kinase BRI1-like 1 [Vitis vinifera]|uniref:Serine/threonine-protein kinase BRI1-like 1 n=1 Tax=Vitis vinifera TaxID=29760 RepID=A0A438JV58_VITVI|nr:Serine/threonine-protein kinase BRI1-like 1 [Vitis vinifera]
MPKASPSSIQVLHPVYLFFIACLGLKGVQFKLLSMGWSHMQYFLQIQLQGQWYRGDAGNIISEILCSHGRSPRLDFHAENELQGTFPQWLAEMEVAYIILPDNRLIGSLPHALFHSHGLWLLALSKNNFSGELPQKHWRCQLPQDSYVGWEQLFWTYSSINLPNSQPTSVGLVKKQIFWQHFPVFDPQDGESYVDFSSNQLSERLSNLKRLELQDNYIQICSSNGMIEAPNLPSSCTSISMIYILYSEDIRSNIVLNDLIVNWNKSKQVSQVTTLISSLGDLENLESLDLSHNQLSGSIPPTLTKLQQLTTFDVSNNQLTGQIPIGGQMNTMLDPNYYANNSVLCGGKFK